MYNSKLSHWLSNIFNLSTMIDDLLSGRAEAKLLQKAFATKLPKLLGGGGSFYQSSFSATFQTKHVDLTEYICNLMLISHWNKHGLSYETDNEICYLIKRDQKPYCYVWFIHECCLCVCIK